MPPPRLLWSLLAASLVLNVMYGAVAGVLVPAQIALADPAGKELTLAAVMTASSLVTLFVHPAAGALSDRTRSRWGRRTPWIVGGALASAAAMLWLGAAEAVWAIALGWLVLQPLLNVVEAPLDAVVADRVERPGRPRAAAIYGAAASAGVGLGAVVGGAAAGAIGAAYAALAAALVVTMVAFVRLAPERRERLAQPEPQPEPAQPEPAQPTRSMRAWSAWADRDFRLVFVGRFALVLGHQLVLGYLLYVVMAYTGASVAEAGGIASLLVGAHVVCLVIGAAVGARLVGDRRVPWIVGSSLALVVSLAIPLLVPGLPGLVAFVVVGGLARGVYVSADLALMIDVLPSTADHGRDLGVLGLATIVPQLIAPAIAGVVLTLSGSYGVLFGLASIVALVSVPFMARVGALTSARRP